jgi:hypothetical protein
MQRVHILHENRHPHAFGTSALGQLDGIAVRVLAIAKTKFPPAAPYQNLRPAPRTFPAGPLAIKKNVLSDWPGW